MIEQPAGKVYAEAEFGKTVQRFEKELVAWLRAKKADLLCAIRKQGIARLTDVGWAILELDGTISIIKADDDNRPADALPPEIVGSESAEEKSGDWNP